MKTVTRSGAPAPDSTKHRKELRRYILKQWLECERKKTIVITYSSWDYADWLKASGLPDNIFVVHYDKAWGTDRLMEMMNRIEADLSVWSLIVI
jgi:hypothetical protein